MKQVDQKRLQPVVVPVLTMASGLLIGKHAGCSALPIGPGGGRICSGDLLCRPASTEPSDPTRLRPGFRGVSPRRELIPREARISRPPQGPMGVDRFVFRQEDKMVRFPDQWSRRREAMRNVPRRGVRLRLCISAYHNQYCLPDGGRLFVMPNPCLRLR